MDQILPTSLIIRHDHLKPRLEAMGNRLQSKKYAPDLPLDAYAVRVVGSLMAETYRLISREPFARTLPRPVPGAPMSHVEAVSAMRAALLALDIFHERHDIDFEFYERDRIVEARGASRNAGF